MERKGRRKRYSKEYKLEVLSYYYSHGENRRKTAERYGIYGALLRQWLKRYPVEKECVSLQCGRTQLRDMGGMQRQETQEDMQKRIKSLEKALEYEKMRCRAFELMIEIAEKEEGISILKKDGAKQ